MSALLVDPRLDVADRKPGKNPPRDRIDLRAEPEWIARVAAAAERFGLSVSAYIRLAVSERLERDEASTSRKAPRTRSDN